VQASRLLAGQLNAVNFRLHDVVGRLEPEDWLRRAAPTTNVPAFTLWHVARVLDSTVQMGMRGETELIESEPWASRSWARLSTGVGYSIREADDLAALVVPSEIVDYADASRSATNQWLKTITDDDLEAENRVVERVTDHATYNYPANLEAMSWIAGRPVWVVLSLACFAHCWGHLEEIGLLAVAARASATAG
jgi:DinB superfamily